MPKLTFTDEQRAALANALLKARPPVIPNTNVIVNDVERKVWYEAVTQAADVVCRGRGVAQDRIDAALFFDGCGVPE
jgi:hypothetical protein